MTWGFEPQAVLELKLKFQIHEGILRVIRRYRHTPRDLERILDVQQPRVSELMRGKLGTLSVARLLWYAEKLGGHTNIRVSPRKAA